MLKAGKCIITVYKARNIEKKGMFGKADPYVKWHSESKSLNLQQ